MMPNTLSQIMLVGATACILLAATISAVQASGYQSNLKPVRCPSTQATFTARTEVVLEGERNTPLSVQELDALTRIFPDVYNSLTERTCDSFFRRLDSFVHMETTYEFGVTSLYGSTNTDASRSGRGRVIVVYQTTGTCRGCQVLEAAGMVVPLYDETIRQRSLLRGEADQNVEDQNQNLPRHLTQEEDCRCVGIPGIHPTRPSPEPRPPRVEECVTAMNAELDILHQIGLFGGLTMTSVKQLMIPQEDGIVELMSNVTAQASFHEIISLFDGRYYSLDISQITYTTRGMEGNLPSELGLLTELTSLNLTDNSFNGTLPEELEHLTNLQVLALGANQLSGTLPAWLGDLTLLTTLHLHDNQFTGTLPASLTQLTALETLWVHDNQLVGATPFGICNLANLADITVDCPPEDLHPIACSCQRICFCG